MEVSGSRGWASTSLICKFLHSAIATQRLCKQSFLGFKNNFLVVRSFNFCLLVEVSKGLELGFLYGVVEFHIWRITFEMLFFAVLSLVADPSPVLQRRPLFQTIDRKDLEGRG